MRRGTSIIWMAGWCLVAIDARASDGIDPSHTCAWGENIGWIHAAPTNVGQTVSVHFDGEMGWLSGYAWGENIGWIKLGGNAGGPYANTTATDWGVNMAADGKLGGLAWGENVGWINFDHAHGDAAIDLETGMLSGHVWGENMGWLSLSGASPDYGVRTRAFDTQAQGTPNWWLVHHGVEESFDVGDGVPAWQKFVMDTDPHADGDVLWITGISNAQSGVVVSFTPASARRYYTLTRRSELTEGVWSPVDDQEHVPGEGGEQALQDTEPGSNQFYSIRVIVTP